MNILLVGGNSRFLRLLIDKLNKEGHRVFRLTEEPKTEKMGGRVFETYRFPYDDGCIREVVDSIRPDVTVFMGAYDTVYQWDKRQSRPVSYTAGLFNLLTAHIALGKGRFVYLSSEEVFQGEYEESIPCDTPCTVHTDKAQAVAAGEELCCSYRNMGKDTVVLRLDHLYGVPKTVGESKNYCARMIIEGLETGEIQVDEAQRAALLHQKDAVEFIYYVITAKETKRGLYQISSGETLPQRRLAECIAGALPDVRLVDAPTKQRPEPVLSGELFAEEFGIRIRHKAEESIGEVAAYMGRHAAEYVRTDARKRSLLSFLGERTKALASAVVPFVENLICFIPFFMLNNRAVGREYFQNIDFYLLYVLLFAIIYGQQQATFSCLLAVAGYCFRQMYHRSGFEVMLDVNTYIWIAQLLILGLVVGYLRDRLKVIEEEKKSEENYLAKQIEDISDINTSNVKVKEILSSQIINQNDSFGRIYEITSSLDKYEPGEVLFYAAEVLAKLMGSKDVAIYTVANRSYARLFSATSDKARQLGNSIHYSEMKELYEPLSEKKVYINKNMDARYPLMANAIYAEEEMQIILMVWGIPWERMTLGQANMLSVVGHLIQNAVLHANRYMSALQYQRYLPGTNILEKEAFTSLVTAYLHAGAKKLTECTLVRIELGETGMEEAGKRLAAQMRQSDFLGQLEEGSLYALLANTRPQDAAVVLGRFRESGFDCLIQEEISL